MLQEEADELARREVDVRGDAKHVLARDVPRRVRPDRAQVLPVRAAHASRALLAVDADERVERRGRVLRSERVRVREDVARERRDVRADLLVLRELHRDARDDDDDDRGRAAPLGVTRSSELERFKLARRGCGCRVITRARQHQILDVLPPFDSRARLSRCFLRAPRRGSR
eukprot:30961-Pelagococcus_subviridis.AAC.8